MPFTVSHIAAVLPLRRRSGAGLPLAALAAGAMSPDLPYFLPIPDWRVVAPSTHSLLGILSWDLVFGLALWGLWRLAARSVHDLAPEFLRQRWRPAGWPASAGALALVVVAVLVGALTHVVWDEFTHAGRFGASYIAAIAASYPTLFGPLPGYRWLQYGSGLVGLAIVVWVGLRQPGVDAVPPPRPRLARAAPWLVIGAAAVAAGVRLAIAGPGDLRSAAFLGITAALAGGALALAVLCAGHAVTSARPAPAPG